MESVVLLSAIQYSLKIHYDGRENSIDRAVGPESVGCCEMIYYRRCEFQSVLSAAYHSEL